MLDEHTFCTEYLNCYMKSIVNASMSPHYTQKSKHGAEPRFPLCVT